MYETLTAFFLDAGFIGIVLFGEGRVSRAAHFFVCCMVSLGTLLSAGLILATNSWMQTPAGATMDAQGIFHVDSWWHVIFTASYPYRVMHMVCASFLTGAFLIAGVSASSCAAPIRGRRRGPSRWRCGPRWSWRRCRSCWATCTG
jgi:cytochrome d ubiquinol oxidase subunit I